MADEKTMRDEVVAAETADDGTDNEVTSNESESGTEATGFDAAARPAGAPKPPDGFTFDTTIRTPTTATTPRTRPVAAPRHLAPSPHKEAPIDLTGGTSMFLGLIALFTVGLFLVPAVPWQGALAPVSFAVVSIICGAIRLLDGRFSERGDAAAIGMVSSLVAIAVSMFALVPGIVGSTPMLDDVPLFGCTTPSQSDGFGDRFDDEGWHGGHRHGDEHGADADGYSYVPYDEDLDEDFGYIDDYFDDYPHDDSDGSEDTVEFDDHGMKPVPMHGGDEDIEQVPLADPSADTTKQADPSQTATLI